jgi:hypothetical protein
MYTGSEGLSLQANFVILGLLCLEMLSFITRFNISAVEHHGPVKRKDINRWLKRDAVEEFQSFL